VVPGAWLAAFLFAELTGAELRAMRLAFRLSAAQALLLPGLYLIAGVAGLAAGLLLGRRWPNAVAAPAVFLMIPGLVITALAPGFGVAAAGRVITGLGAGAVAGAAVTLIPRIAPAQRTVLTVVAAAATVVAAVLGWLLSDLLTHSLSFRMVFMLSIPLALIVAAIIITVWIVQVVRQPPARPGVTTR
jgi:MFS family permease